MPVTQTPAQVSQTRLLHIRFAPTIDSAGQVLMRFTDPFPRYALASDAPAETMPAPAAPQAEEGLWILLPGDDDPSWKERGETWIKAAGDSAGPAAPVRVKIDQGAILWRPGRAVIQALPQHVEAMLATVVEFSFHEGELRRLERELAAEWAAAEADAPLAQDVGPADLRRKEALARTTCQVIQWRMRCARIEPHLLLASDSVPAVARSAASALRGAAHVEQRLQVADDQVEVYEDLYEAVNQRMGEYSNFRKEFLLEWLIVVLLSAELAVMLTDMLWNHIAW